VLTHPSSLIYCYPYHAVLAFSLRLKQRSLLWLKLNNLVNNWWDFVKFCSTVTNPEMSEIQLKFMTMLYDQTDIISMWNIFRILSLQLLAKVPFSNFLRYIATGEVDKFVIFCCKSTSVFWMPKTVVYLSCWFYDESCMYLILVCRLLKWRWLRKFAEIWEVSYCTCTGFDWFIFWNV